MDVPVEAPGTPVASSVRGMDGLNDITVPAKAAMLQARVAELEVSFTGQTNLNILNILVIKSCCEVPSATAQYVSPLFMRKASIVLRSRLQQ